VVTDKDFRIETRRWCPFFFKRIKIIDLNSFDFVDFDVNFNGTIIVFPFTRIRIRNKIIFWGHNKKRVVIHSYIKEEYFLEMKEGILFKKGQNTTGTTK
jgi:hypothetical protein